MARNMMVVEVWDEASPDFGAGTTASFMYSR